MSDFLHQEIVIQITIVLHYQNFCGTCFNSIYLGNYVTHVYGVYS